MLQFEATHNKDYSVVKTFKAACQFLAGRFLWAFILTPSGV